MKAVVIGAGMAGLVAARVLGERCADVTVLDRDTLPEGSTPRRGVPQSAHPHVLLVSGLRELAGLFPGFEDELAGAGATRFDIGTSLCAYRYGRRWPREPTGLDLVSVSRPQLESLVRDRITQLPGVTVRDGVSVTALAGDGGRVTGAVLDTGETLDADLVVDGSGRGSRSDRWLAALGFPAPEQTEIKVGVAYTTRLYRRGRDDLDGWRAAVVLPTPPHENRYGVALPIEGDRWIVSVGGWHIDAPPGDTAAFEEFAKSLPDPIVANLIATAEPLTGLVTYRFPTSRRRAFDRLDRLPAGYVALGDAFCSFNPIYGQGITVAAMAAGALGAALDRHGAATVPAARDYYRAAADLIATPWRFAVGGDFANPKTSGPRPRGTALSNWYARRIALASQVAPDINAAFLRVQQLIDPASVLFRPGLIARVLWLNRPGARTVPEGASAVRAR
ncbi:MAG TPA: FAD-dependent monooxygenase [Actinoplanes sp.]|nr:FAD-dependent monooxygenase [Actinoplanes sp.]